MYLMYLVNFNLSSHCMRDIYSTIEYVSCYDNYQYTHCYLFIIKEETLYYIKIGNKNSSDGQLCVNP